MSDANLMAEISSLTIKEKGVLNSLKHLDGLKATAHEGIPLAILKLLTEVVVKLFTPLLGRWLEGRLSGNRLTLKFKPAHKGRSRNNYDSYGQVSLSSIVSNTFERILSLRTVKLLCHQDFQKVIDSANQRRVNIFGVNNWIAHSGEYIIYGKRGGMSTRHMTAARRGAS